MFTLAVAVGALLFVVGLLLVFKAILRAYDKPPPPRLTAMDLIRRHKERENHS